MLPHGVVVYPNQAEWIRLQAVIPPVDDTKPRKIWQDSTAYYVDIFNPGAGDAKEYWILQPELLPLDHVDVKNFYLETNSWRAYQTMIEHSYAFVGGVPYCKKVTLDSITAINANFTLNNPQEITPPVYMGIANMPLILLPPKFTGEVCGVTYQEFLQNLPKVDGDEAVLSKIDTVMKNTMFTPKQKVDAIRYLVTSTVIKQPLI